MTFTPSPEDPQIRALARFVLASKAIDHPSEDAHAAVAHDIVNELTNSQGIDAETVVTEALKIAKREQILSVRQILGRAMKAVVANMPAAAE